MFKHILLATDGSAASEHAAVMAVELARVHGARLTTLHVADPYPYLGVGEASAAAVQYHVAAAQAHAVTAHAKVEALCKTGGTPVELHKRMVEDMAPSSGIIQTAKDEGADLIVLGSHGRTGIARLMIGSVAARVVAESPLPVLVAR